METSITELKKRQGVINNTIWSSKKRDVAEQDTSQETSHGGLGLPLIILKVLTAKIKDWLSLKEEALSFSIAPNSSPQGISVLLETCNVSLTPCSDDIWLSTFNAMLLLGLLLIRLNRGVAQLHLNL